MRFTKMQGAGNDFVLIEPGDAGGDWPRLAVEMCHRHYGVGADGLLLLLPSEKADCRMRIFNADGSEADACGNGLRCLVKYYVDNTPGCHSSGEISVETAAGVRKALIFMEKAKLARIRVAMGRLEFAAERIPVTIDPKKGKTLDIKSMINITLTVDGEDLPLNLVSVGNPHAVYFSQQPVAGFPLERLGPQVEKDRMFPRGANFEVARLMDRRQIEARVWERGVGETLACGSGACAITAAARQHRYVDDKVDVILPGGRLKVEWDGEGEVFLSGPTATVFTGDWPEE